MKVQSVVCSGCGAKLNIPNANIKVMNIVNGAVTIVTYNPVVCECCGVEHHFESDVKTTTSSDIDTGGAAYIAGNIICNGDFVGRDKKTIIITTKEKE